MEVVVGITTTLTTLHTKAIGVTATTGNVHDPEREEIIGNLPLSFYPVTKPTLPFGVV